MTLKKKVKYRALGLCSGGLDSMLAALVLRKQGIEVEWICFETPFFSGEKARKAARIVELPLTVQDITAVYLEMLKNPHCGYGKHMNPCLDCHALMFRLAGEHMQQNGFDFLFSGEVLAQRPMSQTRSSLRYVEKHSGFQGYILRPLSARKLPETIPEKKGWLRREQLLDIAGRSRKRQIKLAKEFGIREYPAPAGGCLLTDKGYSARLKDLFKHQQAWASNELELLKYGRHLRLNGQTKIIVGRTQKDNENILRLRNAAANSTLRVRKYPSPVALIPQSASRAAVRLAAAICAGYSKAPNQQAVEVEVHSPHGREDIRIFGLPPEDFRRFLI